MKISITIDLNKVSKSKIKDRKWKSQTGQEIVAKEIKLDVVPLKEKKLIKEGDTWIMYKTHFVSEEQTPEERNRNEKSKIIGDGITFEYKDKKEVEDIEYPSEEVNPEDIPF